MRESVRLPLAAVAAMLGLAVLLACEARPADPSNTPLRRVQTAEERLYLRCVGRDPLFFSAECRQFWTPAAGRDR